VRYAGCRTKVAGYAYKKVIRYVYKKVAGYAYKKVARNVYKFGKDETISRLCFGDRKSIKNTMIASVTMLSLSTVLSSLLELATISSNDLRSPSTWRGRYSESTQINSSIVTKHEIETFPLKMKAGAQTNKTWL
jgi:hypothetical protein